MEYTGISADCHIDLPFLTPELFTSNASAAMKERMPFVADGPEGPHWTCKGGRSFGTTLGHPYKNFQTEAFRRMIVNAILWTAQVDVPAQGAPVNIGAKDLELPSKK